MSGCQLLVVLVGRVKVARVAVVAEKVELGEQEEGVGVVMMSRFLQELNRAQERPRDGFRRLVGGRR